MAVFTPTQGRYLSFIQAYAQLHGCPPAESEIATALCVSPPSVNQMVRMLEKKGLILRQPGQPRALQILVPAEEIPPWGARQHSAGFVRTIPRPSPPPELPPAKLYVLLVLLVSGPVSKKFANKVCSRVIEIRGDQTLDRLHGAIYKAYDREEMHRYEFQFGKRRFDPEGPKYGTRGPRGLPRGTGDAEKTTLDELNLTVGRVFGYCFDFGDDWYHHVQVERIEQAIPTVTYPRIARRVGKSPPQHVSY